MTDEEQRIIDEYMAGVNGLLRVREYAAVVVSTGLMSLIAMWTGTLSGVYASRLLLFAWLAYVVLDIATNLIRKALGK